MSSPLPSIQRTVAEIAEHWRQDNKRNNREHRSFVTRDYYVKLFCEHFGDRFAEDVTLPEVQDWIASNPSESHAEREGAKKRKRTWGKNTLINVKRNISRVFNLAVADRLIGFHRLQALSDPSDTTKKRRLVTEEEYQLMHKHATDGLFCGYIELIRETDSRPGEATALKWEDINWEDGTAVLQEKKSDRPRVIPLGKSIEMLRRLKADSGNTHKAHIFVNQAGRPWSSQCLTKRMETVRKRSGLGKDVHLDGLRRPRLVNADLVKAKARIGDEEVERVVSIPKEKEDDLATVAIVREPTRHSEIQYRLLDAGSQMRLRVWAPHRDRGRDWNGRSIGKIPGMINQLPPQFDRQTNRIIQEIDALWLDGQMIVAAFEVEHSTSMYSGLLRMCDLPAVYPNLSSGMKLYVAAPDDRVAEFRSQVARPTFTLLLKNPLHSLCRFLPYSRLCSVLEQAQNFGLSNVKPDFIDKAAELYEPVADGENA